MCRVFVSHVMQKIFRLHDEYYDKHGKCPDTIEMTSAEFMLLGAHEIKRKGYVYYVYGMEVIIVEED